MLSWSSSFGDLVGLWRADLELRELAEGTKQSYRDQVRLQVLPAVEHLTLGEVTTCHLIVQQSHLAAGGLPGPPAVCPT